MSEDLGQKKQDILNTIAKLQEDIVSIEEEEKAVAETASEEAEKEEKLRIVNEEIAIIDAKIEEIIGPLVVEKDKLLAVKTEIEG